jgi:hypothetical protein
MSIDTQVIGYPLKSARRLAKTNLQKPGKNPAKLVPPDRDLYFP